MILSTGQDLELQKRHISDMSVREFLYMLAILHVGSTITWTGVLKKRRELSTYIHHCLPPDLDVAC